MPEKTVHVVKSYDQDLFRLTSMVTDMGGVVESQVAMAAEAIMTRDAGAASRAVETDVRVNAMEREIEAFVIQKWCIYCVWSQSIVTAIVVTTIVPLILRKRARTA